MLLSVSLPPVPLPPLPSILRLWFPLYRSLDPVHNLFRDLHRPDVLPPNERRLPMVVAFLPLDGFRRRVPLSVLNLVLLHQARDTRVAFGSGLFHV